MRDCLTRPEDAAFLTRELERQAADSRGYQVLEVLKDGAGFYADMAGDEADLDREYVVVRPGGQIHLASYNRDAVREQWIARAILKHVHQNLGYFITLGKRWQEGRPPRDRMQEMLGGLAARMNDPGTQGRWIEYEKSTEVVRKGDVVLKGR
jgi:hypothetical protein